MMHYYITEMISKTNFNEKKCQHKLRTILFYLYISIVIEIYK